ncbi:MAG: hypothetical protein WBV95_12310 [Desulfobacterales bacterium]
MGSTPLNQSNNEPREDTEPAAAAIKSIDGTGKPVDVEEPEAAPTDETADALDKTESDTQELSRDEIAALISTDDEVREDAEETVRSSDVSGGTEGPHVNRSHEDELLANSADQIEHADTQLSPDNGRESAGIQFDGLGTAEEEGFDPNEQQSADHSQRAEEDSPQALSPDTPAADQTEADLAISDPATDRKAAEPQEPLLLAAEDEPDSETAASHAEASAEPGETIRPTDPIRVGLWGTGLAVLILLSAAFGFSYLINRPPVKSIAEKQPVADAHLKTSSESDGRSSADSVPKITPNIQSPADSLLLRLKAKQDQMDSLRDQMLSKADEIENLRNHYRKSIRQVEATVLMEKRYGGIHSLQQALETKRIAFELETIRRRQAYIDCLAKPADWLLQGSEELLFLKRKHFLQSLISPVSSQIDPEILAAEKEAALDRYSNSVEALKVDLQKASYQPVDQIWQNLLEQEKQFASNRLPTAPDTQRGSGGGLQVNNQSIWLEICRGRYNRKSELTALSVEAADCLAGWKEPDLFLNGIKELSPETARRLFKWKGSWFCLNGLTDLPPETAEYLFQWNGDWLSLNGVKHLSFESSIFLTGWKGRTLELMGLSPESMESEALVLKHLAQWQRSGGKLFVPEGIRRLLGDSAS